MRSTVIWSFLSLVTLATGGLISGCDSDAKLAKSAEGESCAKTADCDDSLKCRDQVCVKGSGSGGSENGEGGEGPNNSGGSGATGPGEPEPVLSSEGESCTKRADCEEGLACFNQRCVMDATGEGGGGNLPTVRLGQRGETCIVSADCEDDLACTPGGQGVPGGTIGFIGVCSPSSNYEPTGKACAECAEAADCCELPLAVHAQVAAESCAELDALIGNASCTNPTGLNIARCFAKATYCECADDTWACEMGSCVYTAGCEDDGFVTGGCPTYTRAGNVTPSQTCNEDGQCAGAAAEPTCANDGECEGEYMADLVVSAATLCAEGECTCYKDNGQCYRACDEDTDCAPGKVCDVDTSVCMPAPGCETNAQCAARNGGNPRFVCNTETELCELSCNVDYDCNAGAVTGVGTLVCGPRKVCEPIGCNNNNDCSGVGVQLFCIEPEAVEAGAAPASAITG